jgi:alkanesulfonate monooxygenase SsuD/methylene tetrahydromethanopterin reductase-like flavin-dependent oxidoreductase (luciferase family)
MGGDVGLKVDGAVSSQLANVARAASKLERRGYDCCWTAEINHDPFLPLVLAAEHTTRIELGTSIAVAFARNPMTVANIGWDLQAYSDGRFILGLGSQVRPHIEKRFSMPWGQPVADGVLAHAFTTRRYFEEVTTPALLRGMQRSGRQRSEFQLSAPIFVVTGNDESELAAGAVGARKQIAFYGSTPAYRGVLELHGWGDLHTELHRLSLEGQWDAMGSLIDNEILEAFAVVAPVDTVASKIRGRCDGVIDRLLVGFPSSISEPTVTAVLRELRGQPIESARRCS